MNLQDVARTLWEESRVVLALLGSGSEYIDFRRRLVEQNPPLIFSKLVDEVDTSINFEVVYRTCEFYIDRKNVSISLPGISWVLRDIRLRTETKEYCLGDFNVCAFLDGQAFAEGIGSNTRSANNYTSSHPHVSFTDTTHGGSVCLGRIPSKGYTYESVSEALIDGNIGLAYELVTSVLQNYRKDDCYYDLESIFDESREDSYCSNCDEYMDDCNCVECSRCFDRRSEDCGFECGSCDNCCDLYCRGCGLHDHNIKYCPEVGSRLACVNCCAKRCGGCNRITNCEELYAHTGYGLSGRQGFCLACHDESVLEEQEEQEEQENSSSEEKTLSNVLPLGWEDTFEF